MGRAIRGVKGFKNEKQIKKVLEAEGLGSEQADAIAKKATLYKKQYDDELKSINQLDEDQAKEFEKLVLSGQPISKYKYEDLGPALDQYKDMLAKRTAMLEEADPKVVDKLNAAAIKLMDAQYVGNMIDRRYGTDVMLTMNSISRDFNDGLWKAKSFKDEAQTIMDKFNIKDVEDSKRIIKEIEAGKHPEFNKFTERLRTEANEMYGGEVIAARENYVPHYTKRAPEMVAVLRKELNKAKDGKEFDLEAVKSNTQLVDSLKYIGGYVGQKERAFNDRALADIIAQVNSPKAKEHIAKIDASSVKERLVENVPELIKENDLGKLLGGWIDSVTSDASMRNNLRKIKLQAASLKDTDPVMSKYLENYASDVAGGARSLAGASRNKMQEFSTKHFTKALEAEEAGDLKLAAKHRAKAEYPQKMQYLQAQLYPYFLGMRADAVVRNLTQPYLLTMAEIGGSAPYKAKLLAQAVPQSVSGLFAGSKGTHRNAIEELKERGWMPPDPTPGQFQALTKGLQSGGKWKQRGRKALETANNIAMTGYQQSDVANRVVTLSLGKTLAKDIMEGHKDALKYVQRMPPAYRKQVKEGLAGGDSKVVEDRVLDHLMATTQFNYNRASMSEYGREFGSAFSQFSKWPTAIGADIFDGYDAAKFSKTKGQTRLQSGTMKVLRKYLGPYIALSTAQHFMFGEEGPSPRQAQVFSKNLSSAAPLSAITGALTDPGRAFTPPIVSAAIEIASGDGLDTAFGVVPLATYGKFMTERFEPWTEDTRGKKPTKRIKEVLGIERGPKQFIKEEFLD